MEEIILKNVITAPLYKFAGDIRIKVGECSVDVARNTVLIVTIDEVQRRLFRRMPDGGLKPTFDLEFDITKNPLSGIVEVDILTMYKENPPQAREECEHHWISEHAPGHILYWVRICSQCNQLDWDDLENEIKKLLERKNMTTEYGGPQGIEEPASRANWGAKQEKAIDVIAELNSNDFIGRAKMLVYAYVKSRLEKTDTHVTFGPDEVYVVQFTKVLGNWKALVSTTLPDEMYYEVTHDGVACYDYVDAYKKFENVAVPEGVDPIHFL